MEAQVHIEKPQDDFASGLWISVSFHLSVIAFFILQTVFVPSIEPQLPPSVRVDMVGLPEKSQTLPPELKNPESEAPPQKNEVQKNEPQPAPVVKEKSDPKPKSDEIKLTKDKQKEALNKLKTLSALEKIKSDVKKSSDDEKKRLLDIAAKARSKAGELKVKGNVLAAGTELTGVDRLQHEDYRNLLDRHIKPQWQTPEWLSKKGFVAIVIVRIEANGQMISKQLFKSSGNSDFDNNVLETIDRAAPFPPPPEKFTQKARIEGIVVRFGDEGANR